MPKLAPTLVAVMLCTASAHAAAPPSALAVLPESAADGVHTEAALVLRDLRSYHAWLLHYRHRLQLSHVGQAYYASGADKAIFGFDWATQLQRLVALAAPKGGAVPAAVALLSSPKGVGIQIMIKVAAGFTKRLAASAKGSAAPAPWNASAAAGRAHVTIAGMPFTGRVGHDGWLRLAPEHNAIVVPGGTGWLSQTMRRRLHDDDVALLVRGGGRLAAVIARSVDNPTLGGLIMALRSVCLGWRFDGSKTSTTQLLVDLPQLVRMAPIMRRPDLANNLTRLWGKKATDFVSLSVPPALLGALPSLLQRYGADAKLKLPDTLVDATSHLDGRVGYVSFGSPGDWAVGVSFDSPSVVQDLVPDLKQWLATLGKYEATDFELQTGRKDGSRILHIRPDRFIQGIRIANIGSTLVVVNQKSRLESLLAAAQKPQPAGPHPSTIAGPVTPPIRRRLDRPAMLLGYSVLASDGAIMDWLAALSGSVGTAWRPYAARYPRLAFVGRLLDRLPTLLALQSFDLAMTYDAALAADVDGSVLVVQLLTSEI